MIAYLVVRDGNKWRDVYRLVPGQLITIGRASTNRIVLQEDLCSRNHCEIFQSGDEWIVRDTSSRNGTRLDGKSFTGDMPIRSGQLIKIGNTELAFTLDLATTLPHLEAGESAAELESDTGTVLFSENGPRGTTSSVEVLQRTGKSRFDLANRKEPPAADRTSRLLVKLFRLAIDMAAATESKQLADVVLNGLLDSTRADIGAILLLPSDPEENRRGRDELEVLAYKSRQSGGGAYEQVSASLSQLVLRSHQAVLARDVTSHKHLGKKASIAEIQAKSVIAAPIRVGQVLYGLVHLYATDLDKLLGAEDLEFTLAVADQYAVALERLLREASLADGLVQAAHENRALRQQLVQESRLVSNSLEMDQIIQKITRIAPTDATVLIRGESGVGKELVARAIHFGSRRNSGPFVCMNCAALSESLLESELFGHEKGAFTGAVGRKLGKFEQAHRGTLMLDEVGEMSLSIQAKFLRVLEGHPYERVGGGTAVKVDVRVVAATNRDLEKAVEDGSFRKDLYFRLHVVELLVPPLRDRMSDIPLLADYFRERSVAKTGRQVTGFSPETYEVLKRYEWPGNVRELQHAIERAVILCAGDIIYPDDIQLSGLGLNDGPRPVCLPVSSSLVYREMTLDDLEQEHILATLERTAWNKSQAAQILGIERSTLDRKLKRYQVMRPD